MADKTLIAWTTHTFNAWMGCQRVSQGCVHCYAETLTKNRMGIEVFGSKGLRRRTGRQVWAKPPRWNREAYQKGIPSRVFLGSLMDIFEDAPGPNDWRADVWSLIRRTPWLDWQLLTKRPENIAKMLPDDWDRNRWGYWPNVWLGTSIEDNRVADRSPVLVSSPAIVHFISYEPAIGSGDQIPLDDIEWLICGGESGPGFRKMDLMWAYDMWGRCEKAGVPFFFKQDSGIRTEMGIDALGKIVRNYPQSWDRVVEQEKEAA